MSSSESDHLAIAERFKQAIESKDVARIRKCYAQDAVIWHSHDEIDQSAEDNLAMLAGVFKTCDTAEIDVLYRAATVDGYVQVHVARFSGPQGTREVRLCAVAWCRDDKIDRIEEYYHSSDRD